MINNVEVLPHTFAQVLSDVVDKPKLYELAEPQHQRRGTSEVDRFKIFCWNKFEEKF